MCLCVSVFTWASIPVMYWVQICRTFLTSKVLLEASWSIVYYLIYHFFVCTYMYISLLIFFHIVKKNHAISDIRTIGVVKLYIIKISFGDFARMCSVLIRRAECVTKMTTWYDCTSTEHTVTTGVADLTWFQPGLQLLSFLEHDVDFLFHHFFCFGSILFCSCDLQHERSPWSCC